MEAVKLCAAGVVCALMCVLVRQLRPEIEPFVQIGGIIIIGAMLIKRAGELTNAARELFDGFQLLNTGSYELLIKILGIAVITKIGADICNDSGNSALSSMVELAGKTVILFMTFPLIKTVTELAGGLLN